MTIIVSNASHLGAHRWGRHGQPSGGRMVVMLNRLVAGQSFPLVFCRTTSNSATATAEAALREAT